MREILFRGKRVDNGEWAYGGYFKYTPDEDGLQHLIFESIGGAIEVIPETIGQFTGIKDKNGNKIFEDDKFQSDEPEEYYLVNWNEKEARFEVNLYGYNIYYGEGGQEIESSDIDLVDTDCFELSALELDEIIGNIHDK